MKQHRQLFGIGIIISILLFTLFSTHSVFAVKGTTDIIASIDGQVEGVNNQNLNYIIKIINNGPYDAHGSKLKLSLSENMRNISLSCSTESGSVIYPENESMDDGIT